MAERLWPFERDLRDFQYRLQLASSEEQFDVYHLEFPSPFETPWPENNTVPAEYYAPRGAGASGKIAAVIVLDIMDGSAILPRTMARSAAQNGMAAVYFPMSCYSRRRPPGDDHKQLLRDNPAHAADGIRQTVMDVRRARSILASRPEIDPARIGITGISMGGIVAALAAGVDGDFARVAPILAGGDLAAIIFHAHETRKLRAKFEAKGLGRDDAAVVFAGVEPVNFASRIGADRCLMINAANDEVIPRATTLKLHEAAGRPQIVWLPAAHYSSMTWFPLMQKTVIEFLRDGKRPPR
jgi:dienelactone hydrolase